jgi:hypothetical protein
VVNENTEGDQKMNIKHSQRRARAAVLVAVSVLVTGALAGTAWGGTSAWQDVWNQIKPLLSDPGTINSSDNPVHWTKLKGVPAGLADGLDNGVDRAGFGLTKNLVPDLAFAVDTTKIQRRVSGSCPAGQTVQAIGADGNVTCSAGGGGAVVYHGWDKSPNYADPIGNNWSSVGGALNIPSGAWSIVARTDVGSGDADLFIDCRLEAWSDSAGTSSSLDYQRLADANDVQEAEVVLIGVHQSSAPFRAAMVCTDDDREMYWGSVEITATKVSELHTQQLN